MELSPGEQVDRYTVLHTLGQGGMSTVYAVQHRVLGTSHALKVLSRGGPGVRLVQEGRLQARLDSAHVVPVVDGRP